MTTVRAGLEAFTRSITSTLVTAYTHDAANRLATQNGQSLFSWDANGNLLQDGGTTYAYDFANRLISTTLGGTTTQFAYNGDGIRLRLIEASTLTTYTQDYAAPLPVVLQAKTGSASTQYLYSLGTRPLAEYEAAWEYLLADALGSVRQIADTSSNVTRLKSYEPYGSVLNSQGNATSVFGYSGEQVDSTGLVFLRARYMQPRLSMFLSRDPWMGYEQMPGTYNGFNYAMGNPINLTDPTGFQSPGIDYFIWCLDSHTLDPLGLGIQLPFNIPLASVTTARQAVDICRAAYSSANWAYVPIRGFDFVSDLPKTAHDLFGWFVYDFRGNHTDRLYFDANQPLTQELAKTGGIDQVRAWYYTGQLDVEGLREYQFSIWQQGQSFMDLWKSMGEGSVSISMFMGSFWYQVKTLDGGNRVGFRIDNDTTLSSGSHVVGRFNLRKSVEELIAENPGLENKPINEIIRENPSLISILRDRTRKETGGQGGGNLYQTYYWTEENDCDWVFHLWWGSWPHALQVWDWTDFKNQTVDPIGWPAQ